MNRAQRRAAGIKGAKVSTYNFSLDQINKIKQDAATEAMDKAFLLMIRIPVMVLHDKFSELMRKEVNGQCREERFVNLCMDLYELFQDDYVTLDDLAQCLKEEVGLTIKLHRKGKKQ